MAEPKKRPTGYRVHEDGSVTLPNGRVRDAETGVVRRKLPLRKGAKVQRRTMPAIPGASAPKPQLGSGKRFERLASALAEKPGVKDPKALAAAIGMKRYGKRRFQKMAAKGR